MRIIIALALIAPLMQTVFAANLEESRSGTELLRLAAQSGADSSVPALPAPAGKPADAERQAVLDSILEESKIFAGASDSGQEAVALINYLHSPRAAAALRGTTNSEADADRFSAIDAIWALGEQKKSSSAPVLVNMLPSADYTVRLNILAALKKINAAAPGTILGLEKADYSVIPPGDILFRKGVFGTLHPSMPVGHVAAFYGMENGVAMVIHAVDTSGVTKASMEVFVAEKPYYGNRTTTVPPTAKQRTEILSWLVKQIGKPYATWHIRQKGPDVFDCVGLTEAAYEHVGLNPTPDELEQGWGWPLEPHEQYDHTVGH